MKYKCLVFDHDDTVVNSTASIHYPAFVEFLKVYFPDKSCTLEQYFERNFDPGFIGMCREDFGLTDEDLKIEEGFWRNYVKNHIPKAYPGIREIMERQKAEGGLVTVVSHSFRDNILRDYNANGLPTPDAAYGWEQPPEHRKPSPWPIQAIMEEFSLRPDEILVIDDLKPGYDMAKAAGVDFAAVLWSSDYPLIESFMRKNCPLCLKTVAELAAYLGMDGLSL